MIRVIIKIVLTISAVLLLIGNTSAANIDPDADGHRYSYGENIGWLNFNPQIGPGVTVKDSAIEGFIWAENIGWVKLNPARGGVIHDGNGKLSGYAWSENAGWINFSCENSGNCDSVQFGVTIDKATGVFSGYAWGENIGWIKFDYTGYTDPSDDYVKTSWRMNGDVDSDGSVSLEDVIMILQVCAGIPTVSTLHPGADVNEDRKIGLVEALYVIQKIADN